MALGILALIAVAVWWFGTRSLFRVVVRGGDVLVKGRAPSGFVDDVREIVARHGVGDCTIRGVSRGDGVGLVFSGDIDEGSQQRLRNTFRLRI